MSIAYKKLIMARPTKFIEFKLCKSFNRNLVIVTDIVNPLKSDATLEDMEKILKFYTKKIINTLLYNNILN